MKIEHPQAIAAVWLAVKLQGMPSHVITRVVRVSGVPNRLFALASHLHQSRNTKG